MEFSVVIPVLNEAESLSPLQKELQEVMQQMRCEYEIVYVDDASSDSSLEVLKGLAEQYERIRVVSFNKNRGQSAALAAGFNVSRGEWIITLDSDGQNPPSEIVKLIEFKDKFDFVTGVRKNRQDSFNRKIASSVAKFFRWLTLGDISQDTGCSLRLFKKEILNSLPLFDHFHRFFNLLVRSKGFSIKEVAVNHRGRLFGVSKYSTTKRMLSGIFDLWGVVWFKKRLIKYEVKYQR
ncbi:MAG: glycosyltransferase family 2 protein [Candidatus Omnitrophica bacterium]|nr:glycosyltransferase family 2 protein [Candidatus Omnitrophota bacterium]